MTLCFKFTFFSMLKYCSNIICPSYFLNHEYSATFVYIADQKSWPVLKLILHVMFIEQELK